MPLVRALGGEVHLRLSHTVCLRLGRGAQRCPGWGGALGPGTGGLDGPFFPRPQPSPGVRSLVGSKGPSSPLQSPCRASRPGGSQGPLLPRELLCGLGGTTCEGGFPLPSPVLTRGREWAWFGLGPGPRQDPTSHLRALRVPLLPGDFGPVPAQAVGVPELSLVYNPLLPAPSHAGLGAEEGREGPPHPTSALNSTACPRSSRACALWSRELAAPARAPHGEGPGVHCLPPGRSALPRGGSFPQPAPSKSSFRGTPSN